MSMKSCGIAGMLGVLLLVGECDSAEPPPVPSTPTQLTVEFIPIQAEGGATVTAVRTEEGTLHAAERLTVEPDTYQVVMTAFGSTGRGDGQLFYEGPGTEVLRYAPRDGLSGRLTLRQEALELAPLKPAPTGIALAAGGSAEDVVPSQKTAAPLPPPGFIAIVTGTTVAEGTLHLVLEQYASYAAYRRGEVPQHTDFEASFPIRVAPVED